MSIRVCLVIVAAVALLVASWSATVAQTRERDQPSVSAANVSALMRMKLERSKGILEGLSLEDHTLIANNAQQMKLLSMESGWNTIQTEEYAEQSREFRRACDAIEDAAKERDLGRATVGYFTLCVRCVECHRYMRGRTTNAE